MRAKNSSGRSLARAADSTIRQIASRVALSVSAGFGGWLGIASSSTLGTATPVLSLTSSAEAARQSGNSSATTRQDAARIPTEVRKAMLVPESPFERTRAV